jgi:hypothetical protein
MPVCYRYLDPSYWNTTEAVATLLADPDFQETSRKHVINGEYELCITYMAPMLYNLPELYTYPDSQLCTYPD